MNRIRLALCGGFALIVVALVLVLLHAPMSLARSNGVEAKAIVASARGKTRYCQPRELIPRSTTAIRLSLSAYTGPRMDVVVYANGREVTRGTRSSDWTGRVVTVPIIAQSQRIASATVCVSFLARDETIEVYGASAPSASALRLGSHSFGGRMRIEYLRAGNRSWGSMVGTIASNMGLGRPAGGKAVVPLLIILGAAIVALVTRLLLEELR